LIGAALLTSWNIPGSIVDLVRWHHEPDLYEGEYRWEVDLIHVADHLGRMSGTCGGVDGLNYVPDEQVLGRLNITGQITDRVISKILEDIEELKELVGQEE